jgi:hypothetical protein
MNRSGLPGFPYYLGIDSLADIATRGDRVNRALKKISIITEKIAVHDGREIRAMAQGAGVDVIGGNCLGVADSWTRTRIGGALGGDHPDETLLQGTVAIFSNSVASPPPSRSTWRPRAGARRRWCPRATTSTSTTPHAISRMRCATTAARARPCCTPSRAAVRQAGGGVRGRPLEIEADACGGPRRTQEYKAEK